MASKEVAEASKEAIRRQSQAAAMARRREKDDALNLKRKFVTGTLGQASPSKGAGVSGTPSSYIGQVELSHSLQKDQKDDPSNSGVVVANTDLAPMVGPIVAGAGPRSAAEIQGSVARTELGAILLAANQRLMAQQEADAVATSQNYVDKVKLDQREAAVQQLFAKQANLERINNNHFLEAEKIINRMRSAFDVCNTLETSTYNKMQETTLEDFIDQSRARRQQFSAQRRAETFMSTLELEGMFGREATSATSILPQDQHFGEDRELLLMGVELGLLTPSGDYKNQFCGCEAKFEAMKEKIEETTSNRFKATYLGAFVKRLDGMIELVSTFTKNTAEQETKLKDELNESRSQQKKLASDVEHLSEVVKNLKLAVKGAGILVDKDGLAVGLEPKAAQRHISLMKTSVLFEQMQMGIADVDAFIDPFRSKQDASRRKRVMAKVAVGSQTLTAKQLLSLHGIASDGLGPAGGNSSAGSSNAITALVKLVELPDLGAVLAEAWGGPTKPPSPQPKTGRSTPQAAPLHSPNGADTSGWAEVSGMLSASGKGSQRGWQGTLHKVFTSVWEGITSLEAVRSRSLKQVLTMSGNPREEELKAQLDISNYDAKVAIKGLTDAISACARDMLREFADSRQRGHSPQGLDQSGSSRGASRQRNAVRSMATSPQTEPLGLGGASRTPSYGKGGMLPDPAGLDMDLLGDEEEGYPFDEDEGAPTIDVTHPHTRGTSPASGTLQPMPKKGGKGGAPIRKKSTTSTGTARPSKRVTAQGGGAQAPAASNGKARGPTKAGQPAGYTSDFVQIHRLQQQLEVSQHNLLQHRVAVENYEEALCLIAKAVSDVNAAAGVRFDDCCSMYLNHPINAASSQLLATSASVPPKMSPRHKPNTPASGPRPIPAEDTPLQFKPDRDIVRCPEAALTFASLVHNDLLDAASLGPIPSTLIDIAVDTAMKVTALERACEGFELWVPADTPNGVSLMKSESRALGPLKARKEQRRRQAEEDRRREAEASKDTPGAEKEAPPMAVAQRKLSDVDFSPIQQLEMGRGLDLVTVMQALHTCVRRIDKVSAVVAQRLPPKLAEVTSVRASGVTMLARFTDLVTSYQAVMKRALKKVDPSTGPLLLGIDFASLPRELRAFVDRPSFSLSAILGSTSLASDAGRQQSFAAISLGSKLGGTSSQSAMNQSLNNSPSSPGTSSLTTSALGSPAAKIAIEQAAMLEACKEWIDASRQFEKVITGAPPVKVPELLPHDSNSSLLGSRVLTDKSRSITVAASSISSATPIPIVRGDVPSDAVPTTAPGLSRRASSVAQLRMPRRNSTTDAQKQQPPKRQVEKEEVHQAPRQSQKANPPQHRLVQTADKMVQTLFAPLEDAFHGIPFVDIAGTSAGDVTSNSVSVGSPRPSNLPNPQLPMFANGSDATAAASHSFHHTTHVYDSGLPSAREPPSMISVISNGASVISPEAAALRTGPSTGGSSHRIAGGRRRSTSRHTPKVIRLPNGEKAFTAVRLDTSSDEEAEWEPAAKVALTPKHEHESQATLNSGDLTSSESPLVAEHGPLKMASQRRTSVEPLWNNSARTKPQQRRSVVLFEENEVSGEVKPHVTTPTQATTPPSPSSFAPSQQAPLADSMEPFVSPTASEGGGNALLTGRGGGPSLSSPTFDELSRIGTGSTGSLSTHASSQLPEPMITHTAADVPVGYYGAAANTSSVNNSVQAAGSSSIGASTASSHHLITNGPPRYRRATKEGPPTQRRGTTNPSKSTFSESDAFEPDDHDEGLQEVTHGLPGFAPMATVEGSEGTSSGKTTMVRDGSSSAATSSKSGGLAPQAMSHKNSFGTMLSSVSSIKDSIGKSKAIGAPGGKPTPKVVVRAKASYLAPTASSRTKQNEANFSELARQFASVKRREIVGEDGKIIQVVPLEDYDHLLQTLQEHAASLESMGGDRDTVLLQLGNTTRLLQAAEAKTLEATTALKSAASEGDLRKAKLIVLEEQLKKQQVEMARLGKEAIAATAALQALQQQQTNSQKATTLASMSAAKGTLPTAHLLPAQQAVLPQPSGTLTAVGSSGGSSLTASVDGQSARAPRGRLASIVGRKNDPSLHASTDSASSLPAFPSVHGYYGGGLSQQQQIQVVAPTPNTHPIAHPYASSNPLQASKSSASSDPLSFQSQTMGPSGTLYATHPYEGEGVAANAVGPSPNPNPPSQEEQVMVDDVMILHSRVHELALMGLPLNNPQLEQSTTLLAEYMAQQDLVDAGKDPTGHFRHTVMDVLVTSAELIMELLDSAEAKKFFEALGAERRKKGGTPTPSSDGTAEGSSIRAKDPNLLSPPSTPMPTRRGLLSRSTDSGTLELSGGSRLVKSLRDGPRERTPTPTSRSSSASTTHQDDSVRELESIATLEGAHTLTVPVPLHPPTTWEDVSLPIPTTPTTASIARSAPSSKAEQRTKPTTPSKSPQSKDKEQLVASKTGQVPPQLEAKQQRDLSQSDTTPPIPKSIPLPTADEELEEFKRFREARGQRNAQREATRSQQEQRKKEKDLLKKAREQLVAQQRQRDTDAHHAVAASTGPSPSALRSKLAEVDAKLGAAKFEAHRLGDGFKSLMVSSVATSVGVRGAAGTRAASKLPLKGTSLDQTTATALSDNNDGDDETNEQDTQQLPESEEGLRARAQLLLRRHDAPTASPSLVPSLPFSSSKRNLLAKSTPAIPKRGVAETSPRGSVLLPPLVGTGAGGEVASKKDFIVQQASTEPQMAAAMPSMQTRAQRMRAARQQQLIGSMPVVNYAANQPQSALASTTDHPFFVYNLNTNNEAVVQRKASPLRGRLAHEHFISSEQRPEGRSSVSSSKSPLGRNSSTISGRRGSSVSPLIHASISDPKASPPRDPSPLLTSQPSSTNVRPSVPLDASKSVYAPTTTGLKGCQIYEHGKVPPTVSDGPDPTLLQSFLKGTPAPTRSHLVLRNK